LKIKQIELIRKKFYIGIFIKKISKISLMRLLEVVMVNLVKKGKKYTL